MDTLNILIKRISIQPLHDGKGSWRAYFACPCGKRCIQQVYTPDTGESKLELRYPCSSYYSQDIDIDKEKHTFILKKLKN